MKKNKNNRPTVPDRENAITAGQLYYIPSSYLPYPYKDKTHYIGMYLEHYFVEKNYIIYSFLIGKQKVNACLLSRQFEPGRMQNDHENEFLKSLWQVT